MISTPTEAGLHAGRTLFSPVLRLGLTYTARFAGFLRSPRSQKRDLGHPLTYRIYGPGHGPRASTLLTILFLPPKQNRLEAVTAQSCHVRMFTGALLTS